jgi:broad specificity phosphatase PhoE
VNRWSNPCNRYDVGSLAIVGSSIPDLLNRSHHSLMPQCSKDRVTNTFEIRLIRHGWSALQAPIGRITSVEFRLWIDAYNQSGIAHDSYPSQGLVASVSNIPIVVCSDFLRSIESARRLLPGANPHVLPLFREAGRPLAFNGRLKLPLSLWDRISVILWRNGIIAGDESIDSARTRAKEAAQVLVRFAEHTSRVLCVAHGTFNTLVGIELRGLGWDGPDRVSNKHWEGGTYYKTKD